MLSWYVKVIGSCWLAMGLIGAAHAAGSWSAQVQSVMVAMSDRDSRSQPIAPPNGVLAQEGVIDRIHWRLDAPPGGAVNAWLCHPEQCVALSGMRGTVTQLAGRHANEPLYFRFNLRPGQRPVRVQGLQVIVNYQ
ncbi:flagellar protein FlhE [Vreelandella populi]|uniref:Flagellar FlhE n=1 Tax=Vreelandella populi TaxID=2498858 RepID=A0A3S0X022_9GAMM|nr:flagellar protein FlhE [Halomonas populi]RUR41364.1 flagellar FlhE [Halomonas populi]RUR44232.1 flagellar FlhE [Halomonas populi]RUR56224.1 flagellar FlhE [Halomonas populi]